MNAKYIYYTGTDVIIKKDHSINKWRNKIVIKQNKLYKLAFDWRGESFNGYWTFYLYDELGDGEYRGYELKVKNVKTLREYNLEKLI